eukprot:TRINITY_DN8910_c0_g1_i1.p1 TRINITY_DN8910_c0_g1~~TRINITY_DN8910_c0_g1_i1.p1  ORF type:complete len:222 (-),score=31.15 TRINITY_DN8910_c0_g1_i1:163-828(-)
MAAQDRGYTSSYKCHGCIQCIHNQMKGIDDIEAIPKSWIKLNRNPYPLLISFACILCVAWIGTSIIGFASSSAEGYRLFIITSILTYTIFAIVFGILTDRLEWINQEVEGVLPRIIDDITFKGYEAVLLDSYTGIVKKCVYQCHHARELKWTKRHIMDSWDEFWAAGLGCFILGAYVIGGSIYVYNNEVEVVEEEKLMKSNAPAEVPVKEDLSEPANHSES